MKKISIIIPVYNVKKFRFKRTLKSIFNQSYDNFQICISDASNKENSVEDIVKEYQAKNYDIKYKYSNKRLGISDNTNVALSLADGDIIAFLDHDDILHPTALEEVIEAYDNNDCDVTYSDEQIVDDSGNIINQFYKPNFSPDLLYAQNYICHFLTFKREVLEKVGKLNSKYDGAQDYDFILRMYEITDKFYHIDQILYDWLSTEESTSTNTDSKPYAQVAGLNALDSHLKRKYGKFAKATETNNLFVYEAKFDNLNNQKIGIIIPMKDKWTLTEQCIYSIIKYTKYKNYEILILDNNSEEKITKDWLKDVVKLDSRIRVLKADMEFNWSKLQNFGIKNSDAQCFVFLNNDTIIEDEDWLTTLCSNALRDEVGVVGPLLEYEDGTIQHGGVVIGLCGYADHLYKNMNPVHAGINFISPMVPRNVTAVTGACMAISKKTIDKIGGFDENFVICGSDVEMCVRAYENGLRNIYTPNTYLKHLESKSRDSYIPTIDFKLSEKCYKKYWDNGDPFFNKNLALTTTIPTPISTLYDKVSNIETPMIQKNRVSIKQIIKLLIKKIIKFLRNVPILGKFLSKLKQKLKKNPKVVNLYRKIRRIPVPANETQVENRICIDYRVPESNKIIKTRECNLLFKKRINILIPSLNKDKVFGGIATAMKFFDSFNDNDIAKRIIITDTDIKAGDLDNYKDYTLVDCSENCDDKYQVVDIHDAGHCELEVDKNDIFLASAWWTAYIIKPVIEWQRDHYNQKCNNLLYFIQDYEPYFYPWGSRYSLAESTYHFDIPTVGIFNSTELKDFMTEMGYKFTKTYSFDPILNDKLKKHILEDEELPRKKIIICYGRPSVARNAFEVLCDALIIAFKDRNDANEWKFISMGEDHYDVIIKDNAKLQSVGKLSIDEYARMMEEAYLGISLMISPHPSYPPLEMSTFGVKTITNRYQNKDLSKFNQNIISVDFCDPHIIAKEIIKLLDNYSENSSKILNENYLNSSNQFEPIIKDIIKRIK